ncbi:MAG: hypothetical protein K8F30_02120 [Taibaiella sp.]|nr:hypothetical protein [Taibaiella sp.]
MDWERKFHNRRSWTCFALIFSIANEEACIKIWITFVSAESALLNNSIKLIPRLVTAFACEWQRCALGLASKARAKPVTAYAGRYTYSHFPLAKANAKRILVKYT